MGIQRVVAGHKTAVTQRINPVIETSIAIGYDGKTLESIPKSSILGLGCGAPINYANLKTGEIVVDLGSGAGIDDS